MLMAKVKTPRDGGASEARAAIKWLLGKRKQARVGVRLVPIPELLQWEYDEKEGIVRHKLGKGHFFYVEGVQITKSRGREVSRWDQPILNQAQGGLLIILCQARGGTVKFLLNAKFEPGNIGMLQLAPTIQATGSNLRQHHGGKKPRFSEYWGHPKTTVIYKAAHNEEGGRFWRKENVNALLLLGPKEQIALAKGDDFIWLSLPAIKKLMLHDNIVNPFVKTILSPL